MNKKIYLLVEDEIDREYIKSSLIMISEDKNKLQKLLSDNRKILETELNKETNLTIIDEETGLYWD